MKRNVKTIIVLVPTQKHLDRINTTFALYTLFRQPLKVGLNKLNVNHFNYSEIKRMQCSLFTVIE